jgi:hypothetical protein
MEVKAKQCSRFGPVSGKLHARAEKEALDVRRSPGQMFIIILRIALYTRDDCRWKPGGRN